MSDTTPPPVPPAPPEPPYNPPPPEQRSGCATAIMVVFGVILLLPGLCAILFGLAGLTEQHVDASVVFFVLIGLAVGFAGVMLIRAAIKGT